MQTGFEKAKAALESLGLVTGSGWNGSVLARCPSHEDNRPSLSLGKGDDDRALIYCFAGCDTPDVVSALGLEMGDLFTGSSGDAIVATYVYTDEQGEPLIRVKRTFPKGFTQERWEDGMWKPRLKGTRRVLYNLPVVMKAIERGEPVYVTEGEKDVEVLRQLGFVGTTALGGAGKWLDEYTEALRGAEVYIVADNDAPGLEHAQKVRLAISGVVKDAAIFLPLEGKDLTDHVNAGHAVSELQELVPDTEALEPFDYLSYEGDETRWLFKPYLPEAGRVLAYGRHGSLKSLWAMWVAARLSREGRNVAYFALEMLPSDVARRMKQLDCDRDRFKVYRRFRFDSAANVGLVIDALKGYSLIVVDSFSAAYKGSMNDNDGIARLDAEVFLPIVEATGATLLILDNTGNPVITDRGKVSPDHARGASAKGDKMDVTLMFEKPYADNNFMTELRVEKMRFDEEKPPPVRIYTPKDSIQFFVGEKIGFGRSHWDSVVPSEGTRSTESEDGVVAHVEERVPESPLPPSPDELTPAERRALARVKDKLGAVEYESTL